MYESRKITLLSNVTYINACKTGTGIRTTEPHTEVLALAPRLTDDYPTTTVTGSVGELLPHPFRSLASSVIGRLTLRTSQTK